MVKINNTTILISSCDKYEDAWEPFFRLLKIKWSDCNYDIVLLTETKSYNCDFLNVKTINTPSSLAWSSRIKLALSQINTEYVLFFLEDFFLTKNVNTKVLDLAFEIMDKRKDLFLIEFPSIDPNYQKCDVISPKKTFKKVYRFEPYRAKVMISLWRKNDFHKLLFHNEDPWVCEKETSIRSMAYSKKILRQDYKYSVPAFCYHINPKCGYGITGGKWLINNKSLFEKNGIYNVNYNNLGIEKNAKTYKQLKEIEENKKNKRLNDLKQNRNFREQLYYFKKQLLKLLKIDLIVKIIKYKLFFLNQKR